MLIILSAENNIFVSETYFDNTYIKFCIRIRIYADLNMGYVNMKSMQ